MFISWVDQHEDAVNCFTDLYDIEHETGSEKQSSSAEEDSSHLNEDLIACLHSLNKLQSSADKKRQTGLLNNSHSEPHIEFISPPPEYITLN